jgi:hypothetical protein
LLAVQPALHRFPLDSPPNRLCSPAMPAVISALDIPDYIRFFLSIALLYKQTVKSFSTPSDNY